MELSTILKRLEKARSSQAEKVANPKINRPILIDAETFQEMIQKRLPKWSLLNELKSSARRYLHRCGYDNLYYATESSEQLRYP